MLSQGGHVLRGVFCRGEALNLVDVGALFFGSGEVTVAKKADDFSIGMHKNVASGLAAAHRCCGKC